MPVTPFNHTAQALAATSVHTLVPIGEGVVDALQPEDFLLVTNCLRSGSSERLQDHDKDGNLVLDIHYKQKLIYAVTASVLEWDGLADYHPGRALTDRLLAFANGRRAMQFREGTGKLIYLDPRQTIPNSGLPGVEFTIEHLFVDLDLTEYPVTYSVLYTDLDAQASTGITTAACAAVLADLFQAAGNCAGGLTAALYDGDPALGGALLSAVTSDAWSTVSELPGADDTSLISSPAITWDATGSPRTVTHIRFEWPGFIVGDIELAAPLVVDAWHYVRASLADLVFQLRYFWTGASTARPARFVLRHLLGDTSTGIPAAGATVTVKCYDDDPNDGGTLLDTFTVPRDATTWAVTGRRCESAVDLTGTNLAPGGDWETTYVTCELTGVATLIYSNFLSGSIVTTAGTPITIPAGALVQDVL